MQSSLTTERLLIEPLSLNESDFIFELLNTEGWIKFIGQRNINSAADATAYIQKIVDNPNTTYWSVKLKDAQTTIGLVTLIKRDYLEHHDIGFAFLPQFANKGYAYEAANAVLNHVMSAYHLSIILATTVPENGSSIKLLKKLRLEFDREIEEHSEVLWVYSNSTSKSTGVGND